MASSRRGAITIRNSSVRIVATPSNRLTVVNFWEKRGLRLGASYTVLVLKRSFMSSVALITGCAQGIGRAIALQLARQGHNIVINDLPSQAALCSSLAVDVESLGVRALIAHGDVADEHHVARIFKRTRAFGSLHVVVANAYSSRRGPLLTQSLSDVRRTLDVCQLGSYSVAQLGAAMMVERIRASVGLTAALPPHSHGKIVLVSSVMGSDVVMSDAIPYAMSKAAITHMGRSMARELAFHRINVNVVLPGYTDTPGERAYAEDEYMQRCGEAMPWGRLGAAEDVARCVGFLCGQDSDYITGAAIPVDGGYTVSMSLPLPLP